MPLHALAVELHLQIEFAIRYSYIFYKKLNEMDVDVLVVASVRASLLAFFTRAFGKQKVLLFAQNSTPFGILSALALPGVNVLGLISSGARTTFPNWALKFIENRIHNLASGRDLLKFAMIDRRGRRSE